MKKVLSPSFFIAFVSFSSLLPFFAATAVAQNPLFSLTNEQNKRFNPGGAALMMVDDVSFTKASLGAATQMHVTKVEIGIRQEATGSAPTAVALYYTRFNGQTATGTPQLIATQTAAQTAVSKTTILTYGDGQNTLFEANLDDFGATQAYKGFGIGVRILNNNTANGWRVAAGPDYNLNKFWLYGANSWASNGAYYYFADGSRNSFYIKIYGRLVTPLPVKLLDFAVKNNNAAGSELVWSTASEQNAENFQLQTSNAAATDWQTIATVQAAGNSNLQHDYQFLDVKSSAALHYYRLKMNDFDGKFEYSKVLSCKNKNNKAVENPNIAPNPVQNTLNLRIPENYQANTSSLSISNAMGQVITTATLNSGTALWQTETNDWAQGTYFYEIKNEYTGDIFNDIFVVQH
jgi:hypothetical protein